MKSFMKLVTVLALANLFAVAGFVGWLFASGRVNGERLARVRDIFRPSIQEEAQLAAEAAQRDESAARLAEDNARLRELPISSSEQIVAASRFTDRATLAMRALEEQQARLQGDLLTREAAVKEREDALMRRQQEWERSISDDKVRQTDEQFRKAVRLLESAPPKQGREWILELVRAGKIDTAVSYFDAMNPAKSAALLKAFKGEGESKVATDLLERLRMLGLESEIGTGSTDGANSADNPVNSARPATEPRAGTVAGPQSSGPVSNGAVALPSGDAGRGRSGGAASGS
jgi:hypothetical protein